MSRPQRGDFVRVRTRRWLVEDERGAGDDKASRDAPLGTGGTEQIGPVVTPIAGRARPRAAPGPAPGSACPAGRSALRPYMRVMLPTGLRELRPRSRSGVAGDRPLRTCAARC